ncbi:MAG TPA: hypothetical protein VFQ07_17235 [Candidatus Polarisedimenticolia bacterium]|nr:hypothetical protein [Candidatus Polarisedimenticolia bacterium]
MPPSIRPRALPRGLASLVLLLAGAAMAAEMKVTLVRPLESAAADFGVSAVPCGSDLLISGYTESNDIDSALLLRVGPSGDAVWRQTWPAGKDGAIWALRPVGDGTFAGAGWTTSAAGDLDAMLLRVGPDGHALWRRTYPGPGKERLWSVDVTPRGLVAAGEALAADGTSKMLVLRADLHGNEVARVALDGAPVERAFSVQATADGGFALAGQSGSGPREGPGYDARIVRCDAAGKPIWSRTWGGPGFDVGHDLRRLDDEGFLVAGYTETGSGHGTDAMLLRLSAAGEVTWAHTEGGPGDDRAVHLDLLPDHDVAVAGYSRTAAGDWDIVLRVFSPDGAPRWERRFGGGSNELGRTVVASPDGGLTVVGHSQSYGPSERILLIRLRPREDTKGGGV